MASLKLLQVTGQEPVTEQELRDWARIPDDDSTTFVNDLIKRAREFVENLSWRQIVRASYRQTFDCLHDTLELYRPPLIAVTTLQYLDTDGAWQTFSDYAADTDSEPGRITPAYGESWPTIGKTAGAVKIEFVAGYATPSEVPGSLRQAVLQVATQWWRGQEIPNHLEDMIIRHRHTV